MYLVISWDIGTVNPRWKQINDQLIACLQGYTYARPVNTFYMVRTNSEQDGPTIHARLKRVLESTTEPITFLISPPLTEQAWLGVVNDPESVKTITAPSIFTAVPQRGR